MHTKQLRVRFFRSVTSAIVKTVVAALLILLTLPARAADDRAVKQRVPPVYPELAKKMKITGEVKVEATVDPDGKVIDAKALSGSKALSGAAEDAVRKWKFVPGSSESKVDVSVNFEMKE